MNTIIFLTLSGRIESHFFHRDKNFWDVIESLFHLLPCSGKGLKIMNLGDVQTTDGVAAVLQNDDDDAVDPHLERIKNEAGGDESDEEVTFAFLSLF